MSKIAIDSILSPIVSSFPATTELVDLRSGIRLDRSAIWNRVCNRAMALVSAGVEAGERVVVGQPDGVDFLIDIFACWTAGAVAVAVNPKLTQGEQENVLKSTGAMLWLGPAGVPQPKVVLADEAAADLSLLQGRSLLLDAPALMLMTSGTTGIPKGVVHTLRSLAARLALNIAAIGADDLARTLNVLPVFFGHGLIGNCLTALASGGRLHMLSGPSLTELRDLSGIIDRHDVTFMSSVPSFWPMAMRLSQPPAKAPLRVHVGSAPLSLGAWRAIADWTGTQRVFNMYGMTETANWIGGGSLDDALAADGFVGRTWGGSIAVLRDYGTVATSGTGEVLVATPSIMLGFHGMEDKTRDAFHGAWFRTGDIGDLGEDGRLRLVGRLKNEINRAGIKIPAEEIDMLLERHPDIVEACAFGLPDPVAGECVAAAFVLAPSASVSDAELQSWCRLHIRAEAVPTRLFRLEQIPKSDRGKIVRSVVRDAALASREETA